MGVVCSQGLQGEAAGLPVQASEVFLRRGGVRLGPDGGEDLRGVRRLRVREQLLRPRPAVRQQTANARTSGSR